VNETNIERLSTVGWFGVIF